MNAAQKAERERESFLPGTVPEVGWEGRSPMETDSRGVTVIVCHSKSSSIKRASSGALKTNKISFQHKLLWTTAQFFRDPE